MSGTTPKPPINRKVLWMAIVALAVVGVLGAIAAFVNDPRKNREAEGDQERLKEVMNMPAGTESGALRQLDDQQRAAARSATQQADVGVDPDRAAFDRYMGAPGEPAPGVSSAPAGTGPAPVFDEDLLRMLQEAQDEVGARPNLGNVAGGSVSGLQSGGSSGGFRGAGGRDAPSAIIHEKYESSSGGLANTLRGNRDEEERATALGASGFYEAIKPEAPQSDRIINQGVGIPAVLMSRIDTRNEGPITARVNRTIYDSKTHSIPLVPQGSRLIGSYGSQVDPGADRIEVTFERLILPDGRSFTLPGMPSSGGDGSIGVVGKYRSNLIRAIGPTFVVSILGQIADRQIERAIPSRDQQPPAPFGQAAPASVLKETMPKVNEAVMQRYQGVKPYFIVEPGQDIRVILTDDLELPEPSPKGGDR